MLVSSIFVSLLIFGRSWAITITKESTRQSRSHDVGASGGGGDYSNSYGSGGSIGAWTPLESPGGPTGQGSGYGGSSYDQGSQYLTPSHLAQAGGIGYGLLRMPFSYQGSYGASDNGAYSSALAYSKASQYSSIDGGSYGAASSYSPSSQYGSYPVGASSYGAGGGGGSYDSASSSYGSSDSGTGDYASTSGSSYGSYTGYQHAPQVHETTKTIPVHKTIKVPVPHPVPHPVAFPVPIKIPQPYAIKIPVPIPVEKTVQVPVEKVIHYPVEKPIPIKVIKKVPYPVPKPYPVPVPVYKVKYIYHTKKHEHDY